jgi:hypothetical protein
MLEVDDFRRLWVCADGDDCVDDVIDETGESEVGEGVNGLRSSSLRSSSKGEVEGDE